MAKKPESGTATDEPVTIRRPLNGLENVDLKDPLLQLVRQIIGPFVAHQELCDVEPCTCGLVSAIGELQRREILVKRYGTVDG